MINKIYDSLKEVYDPEIPLDIVNLGLVKAIDMKDNCINISGRFNKNSVNIHRVRKFNKIMRFYARLQNDKLSYPFSDVLSFNLFPSF